MARRVIWTVYIAVLVLAALYYGIAAVLHSDVAEGAGPCVVVVGSVGLILFITVEVPFTLSKHRNEKQ